MRKILCEICGTMIPAERLKFLPDTTTCVNCSQTQPYSRAEALGMGAIAESESILPGGEEEYTYEDDD